MDKKKLIKEIKEITSTYDLLDLQKICFNRAVEVIDSKDMDTRDKINALIANCSEIDFYIPDDGNVRQT